VADNEEAFELLDDVTEEIRYLLGDTSYQDHELREACEARGITLIASRRGAYPHKDGGVEVRRVFQQMRSHAIENFNGQYKGMFNANQPVARRGLQATRRYALGAVFVYQLTLWHRFESGADLRIGLKPFLKAA
jgi:transposase InsO family protein